MAIKINKDKIQFRNFSMQVSADGFYVDGTFTANGQFVDSTFQGSTTGFASGSYNPTIGDIESFPFASDTNATDLANFTTGRGAGAGHSSSTHGYHAQGRSPSSPNVNSIQKFAFINTVDATDIGDLTETKRGQTGCSSSTHGYTIGGYLAPGFSNVIEKHPFVSENNSGDVGDLTESVRDRATHSSSEKGFGSAGSVSPPNAFSSTIESFPFSVDTDATDVGDVSQTRNSVRGGQSSTTHGYTSGGVAPDIAPGPSPANVNTIDKFPFAQTSGTSTDVGDLFEERRLVAGISSTTHGYSAGGYADPSPLYPQSGNINVIDKFPFASDTNATDVGNLAESTNSKAGHQV